MAFIVPFAAADRGFAGVFAAALAVVVFLAGIWTSAAQKAFGNYILPQYESGQSGGKVKIEARRGVNPYKAAKQKQQAQANTAIGQANRLRAEESGDREDRPATAPGKKKAPTKRVSYKRKK